MADLLPRNRVLPNTTLQRGDTSQVLPSMRSPSSALVAPLTGLFTHKSLRDGPRPAGKMKRWHHLFTIFHITLSSYNLTWRTFCRATGCYQIQHCSEETPAKSFPSMRSPSSNAAFEQGTGIKFLIPPSSLSGVVIGLVLRHG
ncbi:hypothetical protein TNCV_5041151 [Trichonephila clavipes]|nr:hypothetical protein TNCV_5041151 [Trichonephila clavipes]